MSAFKQTDDGDLALESNRLSLVDGRLQVRQALLARLRVFRGEWFLDQEAGTPWFQEILGKNLNPGGAESAIKGVIRETPGVLRLIEFSFTVDRRTRVATVDFSVETEEGALALQEEIP
jgi:hypothetical protein